MTRETRFGIAIWLVIAIGGFMGLFWLWLFWLCFGDAFLSEKQVFRKCGFEEPATASHVVIHDGDGSYIIEFRLSPRDTADFVNRPIPGWKGWRRKGADELMFNMGEGSSYGPEFHNAMVNEMDIDGWKHMIFVNLPTGECIVYR